MLWIPWPNYKWFLLLLICWRLDSNLGVASEAWPKPCKTQPFSSLSDVFMTYILYRAVCQVFFSQGCCTCCSWPFKDLNWPSVQDKENKIVDHEWCTICSVPCLTSNLLETSLRPCKDKNWSSSGHAWLISLRVEVKRQAICENKNYL